MVERNSQKTMASTFSIMFGTLTSTMKLTLFFIGLLLLNQLVAQCDGNRYLSAVFPEFSITSDIQYGSNTNYLGSQVQLAMDVYEPAGDLLSARPLVVVCHGGFFLSGDKAAPDVVPFCEDLARKGYVVASINYRMGVPLSFTGLDNRFSQAVLRAVQDLNAAIRWFRKNAAEDGNTFRIDPTNIFTFGSSAGGFMALQHAYMDNDEIPTSVDQSAPGLAGGVEGNSGNPGFPSHARALISNCGAMGDNAWIDADENVPACLFHGDSDLVVPIDSAMFTLAGFYPVAITEGSIPIHERLEILGIENCFEVSENAGHVPYLTNSAIYDTTLSIMTGFLAHFVCGIDLNCSYQEFNTGTDEREMDSGFFPYPNPASDELHIAGLKQGATWRILNYDGKLISTHTAKTVRVADLASGMYLIEISTDGINSVRKRIVVMH